MHAVRLVLDAVRVKQGEPALGETVVALDALAPPLAEVPARPELHEIIRVVVDPTGEAIVVRLRARGDQARAAASIDQIAGAVVVREVGDVVTLILHTHVAD